MKAMNNAYRTILTSMMLAMLLAAAPCAFADGMIVPIRPDIRVRQSWAVKYHHVDIQIRNQVATVSIDQQFVNTGKGMIEVEYLFPVPPGAAIDNMTLIVDGKEMPAKLMKAEDARRIYEGIVRKKKDPALLEYVGFGLYRTKAFPLMPGKPARVAVSYRNVCKKDADLVQVWYPLNTEKFSARPIEDVQVTVDIKSAADITSIHSPSHKVTITRKGPRHVIAKYAEKKALPTEDFLLYYKAANESVGATFMTYQPIPGKPGYFMLLVTPNIREKGSAVQPKDIVFVLDRSGSMSGKRIAQAKDALGFILRNLNESDRFNVITYSDSVDKFFDSLKTAGPAAIKEATEKVDAISAGGGTDIHSALQAAMKEMTAEMITNRTLFRPKYVMFLTDGLPTVGKRDEKTILADTKKANTAGVRVFAFGVGNNVNIRLLDKLTAQNGGRSEYVRENEPIERKVSALYGKIRNPMMTDLKLSVGGARLTDIYPRELGDLFEGDQIVVVGRYDFLMNYGALIPGARPQKTGLQISGKYRGEPKSFTYPIKYSKPGKDVRYAFVEKIWAMRRIGYLLDQVQLHGKDKEVVDEIVALSLKHGIMTPYTSFLADETTDLSAKKELRATAVGNVKSAQRTSGVAGGMAAKNRQLYNFAIQAPKAKGGKVQSYGVSNKKDYAADAVSGPAMESVSQVGNQTLYRRKNIWKTADTAQLDLKKVEGQLQRVKRFSDEYFALTKLNSVEENRLLASQQPKQQLLIRLRGQLYLIE